MKSYSADLKKRLTTSVLWMIAIFVLVVGRRILHATNNPEYSVAWFVYVLGIGMPIILILLPRIATAIGIDFAPDKISLRYLQRRVREYEPRTIHLKSKNRNVVVIEGALLDGAKTTSYLLSVGFSKQDWTEIMSKLEALPQV